MLDKKSDKKQTDSRKETEASVTEALKLAVVDEVCQLLPMYHLPNKLLYTRVT